MAKRHPARQAARRRHHRAAPRSHATLYRRPLHYEPLEDRRLMALVTVDTLSDTVDLNDSLTSLREAIFATNLVGGPDTIEFDESLFAARPSTVQLFNGELTISDDLSIMVPGISRLIIDAERSDATPDEAHGDGSRIFRIDDGNANRLIDVHLTGLTLVGGDVSGHGGAILSSENLTLNGCRLIGNSAIGDGALVLSNGGAIAQFAGNLIITGSAITDNFGDFGGGVHFDGAELHISRTVIAENTGLSGAGIYNDDGVAFISRSTIRDNSAGAFSLGGGIYSSGNLSVFDTTISGNSADYGGGVFSRTETVGDNETLIVNSTISGNTAFSRGGGVRNAYGRTTIQFSTITGNTAPPAQGSGIASRGYASATTRVFHTIIAGNTNSDVDFGTGSINTFVSRGYNLVGTGNAAAAFQGPGDQTGVANPLLGPLADNGGFIFPDGSRILTHALLPGSRAINTGDLNAKAGMEGVPTYDQRLEPFSRVVNGRIDIGAFEYQAASDLNLVVDTLDDESDGDHGRGDLSLREAIELANVYPSDDTIRFDPALTAAGPATILLTKGELRVTDDVSIEGPGAELLTVDAQRGSRIFNIDDFKATMIHVSLSALTLTGGYVDGDGGAFQTVENFILRESILHRNFANGRGGGGFAILTGLGEITITSSVISENQSRRGGGGGISILLGELANGTIVGSTIRKNASVGTRASGGGLRIEHAGDGQINVIDADFIENSTDGTSVEGGGVYASHRGTGDISIVNSRFTGNSTDGTSAEGGGVYARHIGSGNVTIVGNEFSGNSTEGTSADGGGIAVYMAGGGAGTISSNTAIGNSSVGTNAFGLGIFASATNHSVVYVRGNTLTNNIPLTEDRGFYAIGTSAFADGMAFIENNAASANNGGISASGDSVTEVNGNSLTGNFGTGLVLDGFRGGTIRSSRNIITGNHSRYAGGGLGLNAQMGARLDVRETIVAGNTSERFGGGVYTFLRTAGTIEIVNTTVSDNRVVQTTNPNSGYAGAISIENDGGSLLIDQSTISGNYADLSGGGVWVHNLTDHAVVIRRSTIAHNTADSDDDDLGTGGGVYVFWGTVDLDHTIIAGNRDNSGVANDVAGLVNTNRSLIGIGAEFLDPLTDNGGPTLTHALLPGSPAINAGDPAAMAGVDGVPEFDQRGDPFTRVHGGRIDIGAFESQPNPLPGDYNFSGVVDTADVVVWRKTVNSTTDLRADGNGDGAVNQDDWQVWRANFGRTAESGEQGAGSEEPEAVGALRQRPAWQPPASPGISAASRAAFRPPVARFAPADDFLASLTSPRQPNSGRHEFVPSRQQSMRDSFADWADASVQAIDKVFETLGAKVAGTL